MTPKKRYTVDYKRDQDGLWVVSVRGLPRCHTQGRTLEQARRRIREALSLYIPTRAAAAADLDEHVSLAAIAHLLWKNAVVHLVNDRLSLRDAEELVRVGHDDFSPTTRERNAASPPRMPNALNRLKDGETTPTPRAALEMARHRAESAFFELDDALEKFSPFGQHPDHPILVEAKTAVDAAIRKIAALCAARPI